MKAENIMDIAKIIYASQEHIEICKQLLSCFEQTDSKQLQMITYGMLSRICGFKNITAQLIEVINFLSGHKVNVLTTNFLFIDEDEEEYEIDNNTVSTALKDNYLIHPVTGVEIRNFKDYIVVYFCLSDQFERRIDHEQR